MHQRVLIAKEKKTMEQHQCLWRHLISPLDHRFSSDFGLPREPWILGQKKHWATQCSTDWFRYLQILSQCVQEVLGEATENLKKIYKSIQLSNTKLNWLLYTRFLSRIIFSFEIIQTKSVFDKAPHLQIFQETVIKRIENYSLITVFGDMT